MLQQSSGYRNRAGWKASNGIVSLTILEGGGYLAELRRADQDCPNLLWEPPWPTMDPHDFDPSVHEAAYGGGSEARLLATIAGHNLCLPFWGDPSAAEYAAGASFHGEAGQVRWRLDSSRQDDLNISALLPG